MWDNKSDLSMKSYVKILLLLLGFFIFSSKNTHSQIKETVTEPIILFNILGWNENSESYTDSNYFISRKDSIYNITQFVQNNYLWCFDEQTRKIPQKSFYKSLKKFKRMKPRFLGAGNSYNYFERTVKIYLTFHLVDCKYLETITSPIDTLILDKSKSILPIKLANRNIERAKIPENVILYLIKNN